MFMLHCHIANPTIVKGIKTCAAGPPETHFLPPPPTHHTQTHILKEKEGE